jgi:ABC-type transport system involved in Fe-S cluster assembly fused permease/ATPase subunit
MDNVFCILPLDRGVLFLTLATIFMTIFMYYFVKVLEWIVKKELKEDNDDND